MQDFHSHASLFHALDKALAEGDLEQARVIAAAAKPSFALLLFMAEQDFHQGISTIPPLSLPVSTWLDALLSAAVLGHADSLKAILVKIGADAKVRRHGRAISRTLLAAAMEGRSECCAILAPFFVQISGVQDAIGRCAIRGNFKCLKILAGLPGAKKSLSAFFFAIHHERAQCAEFLAPQFSGFLGRLTLAATRRGWGSLATRVSHALGEIVSRRPENESRCIHLLLPLASPACVDEALCRAALLGRVELLAALLPLVSSKPESLAAAMASAVRFNQNEAAAAMIKPFQERLLLGHVLAPAAPAAKAKIRL